MIGHGNGYVPTPQADIDYWYEYCSRMLGFEQRVFVDIGCGEGVVIERWQDLLNADNRYQMVLGIESDKALAATAWINHAGRALEADAATYDYATLGMHLLCWLFNPFGTQSVRQLSKQLEPLDVLMVANNPDHVEALLEEGWFLTAYLAQEEPENSWFLLWNGVRDGN